MLVNKFVLKVVIGKIQLDFSRDWFAQTNISFICFSHPGAEIVKLQYQRRFMDAQNYKKLSKKILIFENF